MCDKSGSYRSRVRERVRKSHHRIPTQGKQVGAYVQILLILTIYVHNRLKFLVFKRRPKNQSSSSSRVYASSGQKSMGDIADKRDFRTMFVDTN